MNLRDLRLRQKEQQNKKADAKPRYRAVLCAGDGSRTAGSVWADEDAKTVWFQFFGSGGVGPAKCELLVPELGLGVIVTPTDDRLGWEVVEDDPFLRQTATDNRNYQTIAPSDLQPGGRLMLWVDSRQLTPLATYDTPGTLQINVVSGYYPYDSTRKFFAGAVNQDLLSHVPGGGLTRYVGAYINSANSLQFVDGATIAIGSTPAEPTWPDGAFQLCVIQLDNGQTSINFANDIFDRRMLWADVDSFHGWPFAGVLTVSSTDPDADYTNLQDAITAASNGDTIGIDSETISLGTSISTSKQLKFRGQGKDRTIITNDDADFTLTLSGSLVAFQDITIRHTGTSTGGAVELATGVTQVVIENSDILDLATGGATTDTALKISSTSTLTAYVLGSQIKSSGGIAGDGVLITAANVTFRADSGSILYGVDYALRTTAGSGCLVILSYTQIPAGDVSIAAGDTALGKYVSSAFAANQIIVLDTTQESYQVWLLQAVAGMRKKEATIAAAITDAAASGEIIELGPNLYAGAVTIDESLSLVGKSPQETIVTLSTDSTTTLTISDTPVTLRNLTVRHTGGSGAGTSTNLANSQAALVLDNVYIIHTSGTDGNHVGLSQSAGDSLLRDCKINISGGTVVNYAIYLHTAGSTAILEGGEVLAGALITAHASAVIELRGVRLAAGVTLDTSGGGTIKGWYVDAYNRIVRIKPIGIHNVRLTLETGVPVSTSDQTAKTTIYATPYEGNTIEVWNGNGWVEAPFTELSLSLGGFTADKNSDLWIYDNAGTLALERTEWTNDTTRATALAVQDGRYCKSGTLTRLYLGTFRTTGTTGQCEDSVTSRFVWNYYNRTVKPLQRYYPASHTYNTASFRAFNNSAANAQVNVVLGVLEDAFDVKCAAAITYAAGDSTAYIGCGVNTTTGSTTLASLLAIAGTLHIWSNGNVFGRTGYNFICPVELSSAGGNAPTWLESYLHCGVLC